MANTVPPLHCHPHHVQVVNDVVDSECSGVQWEDIAGLREVKEMMYELIVWPSRNPELFTVGITSRVCVMHNQ